MGHNPRSRPFGAFLLRFVPFAIAFAAAPAWLYFSILSDQEADKKAWAIAGPPCPEAAPLPHRAPQAPDPEKRFSYGGVAFTYRTAMAYCALHARNSAWPREKYVVCQFNNPDTVAVSSGRSSAAFRLPAGARATVTADQNEIRCVVGGWFRL